MIVDLKNVYCRKSSYSRKLSQILQIFSILGEIIAYLQRKKKAGCIATANRSENTYEITLHLFIQNLKYTFTCLYIFYRLSLKFKRDK